MRCGLGQFEPEEVAGGLPLALVEIAVLAGGLGVAQAATSRVSSRAGTRRLADRMFKVAPSAVVEIAAIGPPPRSNSKETNARRAPRAGSPS